MELASCSIVESLQGGTKGSCDPCVVSDLCLKWCVQSSEQGIKMSPETDCLAVQCIFTILWSALQVLSLLLLEDVWHDAASLSDDFELSSDYKVGSPGVAQAA